MRELYDACECVPNGESALIVRTRGTHFERAADGAGSTGDWAVAKARVLQQTWVIVFWEQGDRTTVWRGRRTSVGDSFRVAPHDDGTEKRWRYRIGLADLSMLGVTTRSWAAFTGSRARTPVRYVTGQSRDNRP
jgi:hypothetical protein